MSKRSFFRRSATAPSLKFLELREHFVPFRVDALMERMLADPRLTAEQAAQFQVLRKMLSARFHFEYHDILESLKRDFVSFDPDRDTQDKLNCSESELEEKSARLYEGVKLLLERCNFVEMTPEQLDACLDLQPVGGLSVYVDRQDFSEFNVFFRGIRKKTVTEPRFYLFRRTWTTTVFSRVFVIARTSTTTGSRRHAKMFKDISVENLKIVVPKVRLGMPMFDRLKIGGTIFGSLATTISKVVFALMFSWWLFIVVMSGFVIATFKGIMSFLSSKTKYLYVFSSNLYYQSVSNNKAALTSLVDAAEEQELKEALLAYFMLFVLRDRDLTLEQLDEAVEHWLLEQFGWDVDFEVDDAVRKLKEKELLFVSCGPIYKVCDLPRALRRLDEAWDDFFSYNQPDADTEDRIADAEFHCRNDGRPKSSN